MSNGDADEEVQFSTIFSELDLAECDCVALGSCESGIGRTIVTAEYLGLPTALFAAGSRRVIGSLWKVNQLATAILFDHYYKFFYEGAYTVTHALNCAQRTIMNMSKEEVLKWVETYLPNKFKIWQSVLLKMMDKPFSHPYYWAGTFVNGDI